MDAGRLARKALDGLQYGVVLTGVVVVATSPVSLLVAGDLVLVKLALFMLGMALMLLGAVKLRPRQRHVVDEQADWRPRLSQAMPDNTVSEDGFAGLVSDLPPAAWYVGRTERLTDGGRFLVAWLVAWGVSYLMEAVFHVGVSPALR